MDTLDALRKERGVLLLFDEVQTGLGRTGKNFAYQHYGVVPDALSLAKPVAGGLAAGAIIAKAEVAEVMPPGSHGTTMGGNAMAAAGGVAYGKILFGENLADQAMATSEKIRARLESWIKTIPCVTTVRGLGMIIGIQLKVSGAGVVERCEKRGLIVNCTAGSVIRLLPALNVEQKDVGEALDILEDELKKESVA
jgi:acetylornithine/N-succinyldiaminopimelate aminotransferase